MLNKLFSLSRENIDERLEKLSSVRPAFVTINKDMLDAEIAKIQNILHEKELTLIATHNYRVALKHLEELKELSKDGREVKLEWRVNKFQKGAKLIENSSFNLVTDPMLGLNDIKLVNSPKGTKVYVVDTSLFAKAIALDICGLDTPAEPTFQELDNVVKNRTIYLGNNKLGLVDDIIGEVGGDKKNFWYEAKGYYMDNSPYMTESGTKIYDYFHYRTFPIKSQKNPGFYRDVLEFSYKMLNNILLAHILSANPRLAGNMQLLAVTDTQIAFIVPEKSSINALKESKNQNLIIRCLGRNFETFLPYTVF